MKGRRVPPKFGNSIYEAYEFKSAYLETSDGKRIELNPKSISLVKQSEETQALLPCVSLPTYSFSVTIPWSTLRFKVGPFWMPPPPLDRVN